MNKELQRTFKDLLIDQPFYGHILLHLSKEFNNSVTKTACVTIFNNTPKLIVNTDYFASLNENHRQGLIIHELGHLINFHLTDYKHLTNHSIANQAMDIYINQLIPSHLLPPNGCTWDKYNNLLPDKDTNWYYSQLIQNQKDKNDQTLYNLIAASIEGQGTTTDKDNQVILVPEHKWDGGTSQGDVKLIQKNIEKIVSDVVKEMKSNSPGSIPSYVTELISQFSINQPPKFNWRAYLRRFTGNSTKVWENITKRKKSKRFPNASGFIENYYSHILVAIDTSASVNNDDLLELTSELKHMHKLGHDIDIVYADTIIHEKFKYHPRKPLKVKGRGGTCFQEVIDLYRKNLHKYSCLIYLTDGEASVPVNARGNILWVHGTKHKVNQSLPGKVIQLN